jgi:carboxyl-terminal processing protease
MPLHRESVMLFEICRARALAFAITAGALASCGGGGGNDAPAFGAQACSPNNPFRGDATSPTRLGSLAGEKDWLRGYMDDAYLWYNEIPNVNASAPAFSSEGNVYGSLDAYFNALLTPATTPTGKFKDQFSFTFPTAQWDALLNSGSSVGYGIEWRVASTTPPRNIRVAYVHAGSTAATMGVQRGDTLVLADNVAADANTDAEVATLNAALFPSTATSHSFRFSRGATTFDRTFTAGPVALTSVEHRVLNGGNGQNVGYLLFNDHVLTAEQPLINAVQALKNANVTDLVLDLRYNGGGFLYIASELAYMIAGAGRTTNQVFETTLFSNKRQNENAVTPFFNTACIPNATTFDCTSNAALPTLNLPRVYVLTSGGTCSASEAIINGLRGVDLEVRLIGNTTCGKPYGFFGQDNCGIRYFPIEFQGVNAKGFGDYADGFIPAGAGGAANNVPGCAANDDLNRPLGDPTEGQLAAALAHRASNNTSCPPLQAINREAPQAAAAGALRGSVIKPAPLTSRNGRLPQR